MLMFVLYQVVKKKKVKNLMDHSDLDLANFEAICTKTPPHSSLASSNFINSRMKRKDLCMMPNVYISLGVHGFFRDAPTTLFTLNPVPVFPRNLQHG